MNLINIKDNLIFQILVCIIIGIVLAWFQTSTFQNFLLEYFFDYQINTINII
jgi:DNA-binding transcriptional regulator of glucitol operon